MIYDSDGAVYEDALHHSFGVQAPTEQEHEVPDLHQKPVTQGITQYPGDMDIRGNILPSQPIGKVSDDITTNLPFSENVEDRREVDTSKELTEFEKMAEYLKTKTEYRLKDLITSDKLNKEIGIDDVIQRTKEARKRSDFRNENILKEIKARRKSREYD